MAFQKWNFSQNFSHGIFKIFPWEMGKVKSHFSLGIPMMGIPRAETLTVLNSFDASFLFFACLKNSCTTNRQVHHVAERLLLKDTWELWLFYFSLCSIKSQVRLVVCWWCIQWGKNMISCFVYMSHTKLLCTVFENHSQKSHSTLRAKRAMFTFWVDKSLLTM